MQHELSRVGMRWVLTWGLVASVVGSLSGCASGGAAASSAKAMEQNAIVHQVTDADVQATHSTEPMKGKGAILWVNGLGCPQCASNVDLQLNRMRGLAIVRPDLSTGKVEVSFMGSQRPSPQQFSDAIADAGFTLVKVEAMQ
jgi:copper chaperone CopZ